MFEHIFTIVKNSNPVQTLMDKFDGRVVTISECKRISEAMMYMAFGKDTGKFDATADKNYFRHK